MKDLQFSVVLAFSLFVLSPLALGQNVDDAAAPAADEAMIEVEQPDVVGWLALDTPLREGPIQYAWVTEGEADPSLADVISQLETVASNDQYIGIVIYLDRPGLTLSHAAAMREAMQKIRDAEKSVLVFAEEYSTIAYVLASGADQILLQKKGSIELMGLAVEEMYMAGLLEKIGAKADLMQVGKYKGADESMTRSEPSEAWNQNMDALLDDLYGQVVSLIAEGRGRTVEQIEEWMADAWTMSDQDYVKRGLVDQLVTRDMIDVTEIEFGDNFIWDTSMGQATSSPASPNNPMALFQMMFKQPNENTTRDSIAVIHATGSIVSGDSEVDAIFGGQTIGSRTMNELLGQVRDDDNIKGVVLRINSPGGSALASEVMWQAVRELGEKKPVYVSVGRLAASGGYYIASAGDEIYVGPSSILGSIGVVGGKIVLGGTYEKIGITVTRRARGPMGDVYNSVVPFTPEQRDAVQVTLERIYDQFTDRVMIGRGQRLPDIASVAEGRLFTGRQCVENGMADKVGDLDDTVEALASELGLAAGEYDRIELPRPISFQQFLSEMFGGTSAAAPTVDMQASSFVATARALLGEDAWRSARDVMSGMMQLRSEPNLAIMPRAIVVK